MGGTVRVIAAGIGAAALAAGVLVFATAEEAPPRPAATAAADAPLPTAPATDAAGAPADSAVRSDNLDSAGRAALGAAAAVQLLPVKGRAPMTGYNRDLYGAGWVDIDRNGCDTRNDMLRAELTYRSMSGPCKVLSGWLVDPYTGTSIRFEYGGVSEVDIDHVVALGDAWQKGAQQWPFAKRVAFANDPLNLQPADAAANRAKGDGDTATWLPPAKPYRCTYVARQVAVKAKYGLWVTAAESDAMLRVLRSCPGQALPGPGAQPTMAGNTGGPEPARSSQPVGDPVAPQARSGRTDPRFATCGEAIAAGFGPYAQGQDPEYGWYIDADGDGSVCES